MELSSSLRLLLFFCVYVAAIGQKPLFTFSASLGSLQLAGGNGAGRLVLAEDDWPGVIRAGKDLAMDFGRVTGTNLSVTMVKSAKSAPSVQGPVIIAGTIRNSSLIDSMVSAGKIDISEIKGKWEAFQTQVVSRPMPGISQALVISGSDKRGTIYGMYDISEQIGVSPWCWWADVRAKQHSEIYVMKTIKTVVSFGEIQRLLHQR
jgi:hypothetical protein